MKDKIKQFLTLQKELNQLFDEKWPEYFSQKGYQVIGAREDGEDSFVVYVTDEDELDFNLVCFDFNEFGEVEFQDL